MLVVSAVGDRLGFPTRDLGEAGFTVWSVAVAAYFGCARIVDRKH
jgi:hypothetical protein